ncbi:MAG: hypothetical protein KGN33_02780 [Paracoccaceae bacterium]|nr:hypothetical protein [Paracoccaceae bacterium]
MNVSLELLKRVALANLEESREGDERWSYLFRTPDAQEINIIDKDAIEGFAFEPEELGRTIAVELDPVRLEELQSGISLPTEMELESFRGALAQHKLDTWDADVRQIFIVPVSIEEQVAGFAVFDCGRTFEMHDPRLLGVFRAREQAVNEIQARAAVWRAWPSAGI